MLVATLFFAFALILLLPLWQKRLDPSFPPVLRWVHSAEARLLLGHNIFRHDDSGAGSDLALIQAQYKHLYFQGQSLEVPLRALYELLLQSQVWLKLEARWRVLVATRLLCLVGLIFFGRTVLAMLVRAGLLPAWNGPLDGLLAFCGLLLIAVMVRVTQQRLPQDWFWPQGFSEQGRQWLQAQCCGLWQMPGEWQALWVELGRQERLNGISVAKEKEKILELWVKEQALHQQGRVSRFEDLLPLCELVGGCLLAFCLLFAPFFACWQRYQF